MSKTLKGFITYSHEDAEAKDELRKRLAVMEQQKELVTWDDGQLTPGDGALQEDILKKVVDSDLLLYLVSAASLDSKNCNRELAEAIEGDKRVIPIILERCDWLHHQLSGFEVLPHKGKPLNEWIPESKGWQNVVEGIRKAADKVRSQSVSSSDTSKKELHAEMDFQYGNILFLLGQLDMAIEAYSSAINLNPLNARVYNNRGIVYGRKGEIDNAIEDFSKAIQLKPDYATPYYGRGIVHANIGDFDNAIRDYTEAIKYKADFANLYHDRGIAYAKKSDFDNAIGDHTEAIKYKADFVEAYFERGSVYYKKGDFDNAIGNYTEAIKHKTDFAEAYNNRGNAYIDKGEVGNAIRDFTKAMKLKLDIAEVYHNRGRAYTVKSDSDNAIKDFTKAIQLKPDYAEAYSVRGVNYAEKGEFEKSIKDYNKAIELNPEFAGAYNNRAMVYETKNDFHNAIKDYNRAIQIEPDYADAYNNRGTAYRNKGDLNNAIRDYTEAIRLNPSNANTYNNRGIIYSVKDEVDLAIEDYTKAIELNSELTQPYYSRAIEWLCLREWEKAKTDLIAAKDMGMDIIASFHNDYKNVETYEQRHRVKLPEDIALLLTQRRRDRYPKMQKVLDADGKPLESPNVVNLRAQLRNAGTPLGGYVKSKPSFGINTAPTEAFVVDKTTRDKLIAENPLSVDILKPFLHGQDLRRWHVDTPHQWLIFAHRGIAINDYPAILKHLEKYQETLSRRRGKQKWYELPASLDDAERFAQPKLVCPDTYNHQTFAVDTAGYYYGKTAYLIPTEETWLCGLLNSRTVEWFYSQVSKQLTIDPLRARSGYIQQIPIPDIAPVHKALIAKIVDYLIYLQQQPEINSKDLKYARDRIMLGYFERVIDGLVYEAYLPAELHKSDKVFLQPLLDEGLPLIEEIQGDKMSVFRNIFELLYEKTHPIRRNLFFLDSVKLVRIIEGKL